MADRVFVAYYRSIQLNSGFSKPTLEQQQEELKRRLPMHSTRHLVAEFIEHELGKDGKSSGRTQFRRAMDECKKYGDAVLVLPRTKSTYDYKGAILDPIEEANQRVAFIRGPLDDDPAFQDQSSWTGSASSVSAGQFKNLPASGFSAIWSEIKANCSDILGVLRKDRTKLLYRGLGEDRGDGYVSRPLDNKPARDSKPQQHQRFVDWMKGKGFEAHRGNSVYASPNPTVARNYTGWKLGDSGTPPLYAIFPCNGFKFSWSRAHPDFAVRVEPEFDEVLVEDALWGADIVNKGIFDALNHEHEMLFAGVPFYALRLSTFKPQIEEALSLALHNKKAPTCDRRWDLAHT